MDRGGLKKVSKMMSYVLRHRPDEVGIELGGGGWIEIKTLLAALGKSGTSVTRELFDRVVSENDKQRFEISDDGLRVRARQGHSVAVDLGYEPADPPSVLYHGTATRFLDSILASGLVKGERHHVHLSTDKQTMLAVAIRHGKPVMLEIDSAKMQADGYAFYVTGNHVWLTDHVPTAYLRVVDRE